MAQCMLYVIIGVWLCCKIAWRWIDYCYGLHLQLWTPRLYYIERYIGINTNIIRCPIPTLYVAQLMTDCGMYMTIAWRLRGEVI